MGGKGSPFELNGVRSPQDVQIEGTARATVFLHFLVLHVHILGCQATAFSPLKMVVEAPMHNQALSHDRQTLTSPSDNACCV